MRQKKRSLQTLVSEMLRVHLVLFLILTLTQNQSNCQADATPTTKPLNRTTSKTLTMPSTSEATTKNPLTVPFQLITKSHTVTTNENQRVEIPCTARGIPRPTITWKKKQGQRLLSRKLGTSRNTRDGVTSTLTIPRVQAWNAGNYICIVTNKVTRRTFQREITLVVRVPFQLITKSHTVTTNENQRVEIPCTARGIPRPTITWKKKQGQRLLSRQLGTSRNTRDGVTSILTIPRVQAWNAGDYICIVTNKVTRRTFQREITLVVRELPGEPTTPNITAIGTSHAEITWFTQSSGAGSLLSHTIKYKVNDSQQHLQLVVNVTRNKTEKMFSAFLRNLHPYTLYSVWVQAENTIGQGPPSTRASFTTYMNGSMLIRPENQRRELGKPVIFTCLVSGYPEPTVEWKKETRSIASTKDGRIKQSLAKTNATAIQRVLNITAVTRNDNGTYSCESFNAVENLNKESELLVLEKPDKLIVNATQFHDSVTLFWLVTFDGNSPITNFSVQHFDPHGVNKSHQLTGEEKQLTINNTKLGARHIFIVRAINEIGKSDPVTLSFITVAPGPLAARAFPVAAVASPLVIIFLVAAALTVILLWRFKKLQRSKENDDKKLRVSFELEPKIRQEEDDYDDLRANEIMIHQVRNALDLNELKAYYTQMNEDSRFGAQYRSIITPGCPARTVANLPCNKVKNRYINIGAYDHSRVILSEDPQVEGSDYINANYINGYNFPKRYIAAMGPKPETVNDFWKMVWEQNTSVIVMLTQTMEKEKVKCHQYWPNKGHVVYDDARIELMSVQETLNFEIRKLQLSMQSEPNEEARTILHYYFTAWPDHDVPDNATGILDLRRQVNAAIKSQDTGPIIVHCSAGVGRTGTYIATDVSLNRIKEEGTMNVLEVITHMRGQRGDMVQNENQYKFIYTAILEAVAFGDSEISATDLRVAVRKLNEVNPSNGKTYIQEQFELLDGVFPEEANPDQATSFIRKDGSTEVVPYEFNRVLLSIMPGKETTFINASFIGGFQSKRGFIATEAPMGDKVNDFWRMVWERNVQTVVMVAKLNEKYKNSMITRYWPDEEPEVYGNFTISTLKRTSQGPFIERELEMKYLKTGDVRKIMHFHFFRWPLLTSPEDSSMVLDLIRAVQNAQHFTGQRPILVHCSDGAGRTGAFCCLYSTLERLKVEGTVDILMTARLLRTQRPRMISTLEQYKFCYKAVIAYLDSFNQYSNFEVKEL